MRELMDNMEFSLKKRFKEDIDNEIPEEPKQEGIEALQ